MPWWGQWAYCSLESGGVGNNHCRIAESVPKIFEGHLRTCLLDSWYVVAAVSAPLVVGHGLLVRQLLPRQQQQQDG